MSWQMVRFTYAVVVELLQGIGVEVGNEGAALEALVHVLPDQGHGYELDQRVDMDDDDDIGDDEDCDMDTTCVVTPAFIVGLKTTYQR